MADSRNPRQNRRGGEPTVVPMRRGGISQARRYSPRGKTVREAASDPYRPVLRLVNGGQDEAPAGSGRGAPPDSGRAAAAARGTAPSRRSGGTPSEQSAARKSSARKPAARGSATRKAPAGKATSRKAAARKATPGGATRGRATRGRATTAKGGAGRRRPAPPRRPGRRTRRVRLGNPMRRLRFGTALVLVLFLVIAGRLVELQLTDAAAYAADGLKQRLREVPLLAPRGSILDRSGAVLARSVDARYVYADPEMVDDAASAAAKLSPVLGIAKSALTERMKRSVRDNGQSVRFVYLARGVSVSVGDRVTGLNIKGIGVHRDERREVPGHDLAANIIGFTGQDANGLTGMESQYDSVLRGRDGERVDEIGMNGVPIPDGYHRLQPAKPGRSLRLTIDRDLQYEAQRTLAAKMQQVRATFGSAVVLDVQTGEVRAMASWPSYDAANAFDAPGSRWTDYNTEAVVEPGSVHKPFVLGAALEEGVITPNSTPVVPPTITKGGATYRDTHWHTTRKMTIPGILAHSSNVGTIEIASKLGAKRLCEYQKKFGLGTPTGVGIPGEASGIVQPPNRWSGSSYGSVPIGMGVAVTPIQMAAAYAAIANDGVWLQPRLVDGTIGGDGKFAAAAPAKHHRVLSTKVSRQLRLAMEAVTTAPDATGLQGAIPGYRVAGKTGTGLKVKNNHYEYGNVTSFIGMAPADAPRFVVAVFAHVPHGAGGGVAGPVFRSIMTSTLQHYAVPPTGRKAPQFKIYG